ncbi:inositol monophosphatase family protein [Ruixingdingia sedimenti]|uniref:Inositol monophosphatase n=1 Tax=Ruixingdingia sedimenti TaxID=3073604 RepID=A0ABU1F8D4_9RHOB|nr:inositol monophosphatase [Xinfangfangia sp. LG-4]MDR5653084.1 inositol monophosphatase [Xinfangfangia sp. LG-4]
MTFTPARIGQICALLSRVGKVELLPRFRAQMPNRVYEKTSAFDVFSEADQAAETEITAELARLFPGALLVGEETSGHDAQAIARLGQADIAFLVDPIDGTKNFTSGLPLFGTMIAGLIRGEIVFAAIHDPVCGDTALALRGEGAWMRRADGAETALRVAPPCAPGQMTIVAGTNFLPADLRPVVLANLPKFAMNFWLRCAAHEYRLAAGGQCDLLVYNKLMPWDHAAGWLLHREAGGYSAHFDGTDYLPVHTTGGLICAPDRDSWLAARDCLFGGRIPGR